MVPVERGMKVGGSESYLEMKLKNPADGQSVEHEEK